MILTKLLIVLASLLYYSWTINAQSAVERELARIRAAGEPTTYEELAASYRLPVTEVNSSAEWGAVVQFFSKKEFIDSSKEMPLFDFDKKIPPPSEEWPEQQAVKRFLESQKEGKRLIKAAAEKNGSPRFPIKFEEGLNTPLPHPQFLRSAAKFIELQFHLAIREGNEAEVYLAISQGFAIARALENEPHMISHVPRLGVYDQQGRMIVLALRSLEVPDELLEKWQVQLRECDGLKLLRLTLIGERVAGIQAFVDLEAFPVEEYTPARYGPWRPRHPIQFLCYLHTCRAAIDETKKGFPKASHLLWQMENWKFDTDVSAYEYFRRAYVRKAFWAFGTYAVGIGRTIAKLRATDTLIAATMYRRKNGVWPQKLDSLTPKFLPAIPLDPFRDRPLSFVLDENRLTVYGFGFDQEDDGGNFDWSVKDDVVVLELQN